MRAARFLVTWSNTLAELLIHIHVFLLKYGFLVMAKIAFFTQKLIIWRAATRFRGYFLIFETFWSGLPIALLSPPSKKSFQSCWVIIRWWFGIKIGVKMGWFVKNSKALHCVGILKGETYEKFLSIDWARGQKFGLKNCFQVGKSTSHRF